MVRENNDRRFYAVATLLLVVFTFLLNHLIEQNKLVEQVNKTRVTPSEQSTKTVLTASVPVNISMANFQLPTPSEMNVSSRQVTAQTTQASSQKSTNRKLSQKSTHTEVKQQLNKMTKMNGDMLQLKFPDSISKTEAILQYMHNCIGIDLAAYTGKNLIMLKQRQASHSPLLRIASGHMTQIEHSLLELYASQHLLARLYPMWFDMRLSQKIHEYSAGADLQKFSGVYQLKGQTLWLHNINMNNKNVSESWLLADAENCLKQ
ncbi:hypothetical protein [Glaciecola petra]|uniref:Orphan protein n=1 Tax=Glaciecola petra TaxID=3075602 RepID=A0ABU2ZN63_9ALTE|nr:hypothetical protein [Aestuariibacter sp. P117]MDT0594062.1 hypothetical protein [Aestuariibacter sp. P117]